MIRWGFVLASAVLLAGCGRKDVVARVGDAVITRADVALYRRSHGDAEKPKVALEKLIEREVLAQGARRDGVAKKPEIEARVKAAEREVLANAYLDHVTHEALTEKALHARYSAEKKKLARRQVHVAQIIIRLAPDADARAKVDARERINALYAKLRGGADFAKLAEKYSEDPVTAERGGDLGVIREGTVNRTFFDAVVKLHEGDLSEPFRTRFGFHLVKALADPKTVVPPFDRVRGLLAAEARREEMAAARKKLEGTLRIQRFPKRLKQTEGASK